MRDPRAAFATEWADAVAGTSYVSWSQAETRQFLRNYTDRFADVLVAEAFSTSVARDLGRDLVGAHFTDALTLGRTTAMLGRLPDRLRIPSTPQVRERVAKLLGDLALSYTYALRERTLAEQEEVRRAAAAAQRKVVQALRASEAKFRAVFADAPIGVGIADVDGRILDVNLALVRMLGYRVQEFRQRNVTSFVHPDDTDGVWEAYKRLVTGERDSFQAEKRFFRRDGGVVWTHLAVSLIRDDDGKPRYQLAMLTDLTDYRHLRAHVAEQATDD